jgi:type I restriction enzyme S subunit
MIGMICDRFLPNHYVVLWARQNMEAVIRDADGTTFFGISKRNLRPIPAFVPPRVVLDRFEEILSPIFHCIK